MPADRVDLERRLASARPEDTVRGVFFKGVLAEVETLAGTEAVRSCRAATAHDRHVVLASYPVADFLRLLWAAADRVEAKVGGVDEAMRRFGARAVDDFFGSAVGRALLLFVRHRPERLVNSAPIAYRSAVSYGDRTVTWSGDKSCVIRFAGDFLVGPYHEGVICSALTAVGGRHVRAAWRVTGPLEADYEVAWL